MGLLNKMIKSYQQVRKEEKANLARVAAYNAKQSAIASTPKTFSPPYSFIGAPMRIGDATVAYRYPVDLCDPDHTALLSAFSTGEYLFSMEQESGATYAVIGERRVGIIEDRYDMIADWISRGDPYRLYLNSYTEGDSCHLFLVFYKDKSAAHKSREQSVVALVAYKGAAKQEIIECMTSKLEVNLEEFYAGDDVDIVATYRGEAIGTLPPKASARVAEFGYAYAEIEKLQKERANNGDAIYSPVIRIYW